MVTTRFNLLPTEVQALVLPDEHARGAATDAVMEEVLHRIDRVGATYTWGGLQEPYIDVED